MSGYCEKKKIPDTSVEPDFHALLCLEHHKQWEKGTEIKIGNGKTKFAKGNKGGGGNGSGNSNTPNPNLTDKQRERRRNQRRAYRARKKAKKQNAGSGSSSGQSSAQSSNTANTSEKSEKSESSNQSSQQSQQSDGGTVQVSSDGMVSMTAQQLAALMSLSTASAKDTASESKPTGNNSDSAVSANATTKEPDIYQQLINVVSAAKTTASKVVP